MNTTLKQHIAAGERWVVFVGPCLPELARGEHPWGIAVPPIRRGDLPHWWNTGYRKFALLDGEFGQSRSVSVIEIREVLRAGGRVVGGASMGALRAAEAGPLGMEGVGWIYERYANGDVESDEEVALTFDPDGGCRALTVPLVNLRWAVEHFGASRGLTALEGAEFLALAGGIDYRERSWSRLRAECRRASSRLEEFAAWAACNPQSVDRKRLDALQLLEVVGGAARQPLPRPRRAPGLARRSCQPLAGDFWGTPEGTRKLAGSQRQLSSSAASALAEPLARACGMSRVAEISGLDPLGVYSFSSIRPFAEDGDFTVTGGKGYTRESARLGALAEAVERACLSPRGLPLAFSSLVQRSQVGKVLNPAALLLDSRSCWTPEDPLHWWTARDLTTEQELWLPAAAIFYPFDQGNGWLFSCNTAGTAIGASLSEAVLYGLLEVVERDQLARAELLRSGRRLLLNTIRDERCRRTLDALAQRNIVVHCWVADSDYPFPLFYVILEDLEHPEPAYLVGGLGCHLDPLTALQAALLEAVYSRLTVISGAREDIERDLQGAYEVGYEAHRARALSWQLSGPDLAWGELPSLASPDIASDLRTVAAACRQAGLGRILCTDLSPEGAALHTVRVVVAGAEQAFHERTRLGRRALRWLQSAQTVAAAE